MCVLAIPMHYLFILLKFAVLAVAITLTYSSEVCSFYHYVLQGGLLLANILFWGLLLYNMLLKGRLHDIVLVLVRA